MRSTHVEKEKGVRQRDAGRGEQGTRAANIGEKRVWLRRGRCRGVLSDTVTTVWWWRGMEHSICKMDSAGRDIFMSRYGEGSRVREEGGECIRGRGGVVSARGRRFCSAWGDVRARWDT